MATIEFSLNITKSNKQNIETTSSKMEAPEGLLEQSTAIDESVMEIVRSRLSGGRSETAAEMFWRVASNVTNDQCMAWDYYGLISQLRFMPNSPTFTG